MYQSGEVDHLVATDAIGMGLNMDLGHVAFAQLHKFDGRHDRRLTAAEIGRSPAVPVRHMADGTFGTTNGSGPSGRPHLSRRRIAQLFVYAAQAAALAQRRPIDFTSLEALNASLYADPPAPGLIKVRDALDDRKPRHVGPARTTSAPGRAGPAGVRLLWQSAISRYFRRTLTDAHLQLLTTVFRHLTDDPACCRPDWVGSMIARLDRMDGDIDTLVGPDRHVRTWTYLSHRVGWFDDPLHWQGGRGGRGPAVGCAARAADAEIRRPADGRALLKSLRERASSPRDRPGGDVVVERPFGRHARGLRLHARGERARDRAHALFAGAARRAVAGNSTGWRPSW
jgi:ATP-dependent RNA helicase SUPV3L1/SUV3